jgi:UDP-N-acetylglucosamine--N-acetylmuramyl-(pentapeptide) pyrophosphoryl-undecaprenol N-acetylglucosamine transferase
MRTRVMIMAGGTGGHVFPALAVAEELRGRGVEVVWMGTRQGVEAEIVSRAGFEIRWVNVAGLRGKGLLTVLAAPVALLRATIQSLGIVLKIRPRAVLGMGGFVTGPGGLAAWLTRRPLIVHEQNAVAGLTNRILEHLARRALSGFPEVFEGPRSGWVGNPVRREITALPAPHKRFSNRTGALRLLVLGGSLGAVALNETVPQALGGIPPTTRPTVRHQTGRRNIESASSAYRDAAVDGEVVPFIEDMAQAYGWADLVVCRAGALTLAELTAAGVGAILVPYPHAVDDHQTVNARHLSEAGAALLAPQCDLTPESLRQMLEGLTGDRQALLDMAQAARCLARPDAAREVADACLEVTIRG